MKKLLPIAIILFICLASSTSYSQTDAGKDKIILLNGKIKKCYVIGTNDNIVLYKLSENGEEQKVETDKVFLVLDENNEELAFYGCSGEADDEVNSNAGSNSNQNQSSEKDCEKNETGDWCFKNNTTNSLQIWVILSGMSMQDPAAKTQTITVSPGETGCFYKLPAGAKNYRASKVMVGNTSGGFKDGQINIKKCGKGTTEISF